jgi:hypothetical protein
MIVNMLSPSYADLLKLDHDWFYLSQTWKTKGLVASHPLFLQVVIHIRPPETQGTQMAPSSGLKA